MSYDVVLARSFKHSVKKLGKRFPHVKSDVRVAVQALLARPRAGVVIPGGQRARKLRVLNTDLRKGKRSGYRLIYFVEDRPEPCIYLVLLYSKSDRDDVTAKELKQLLADLEQP